MSNNDKKRRPMVINLDDQEDDARSDKERLQKTQTATTSNESKPELSASLTNEKQIEGDQSETKTESDNHQQFSQKPHVIDPSDAFEAGLRETEFPHGIPTHQQFSSSFEFEGPQTGAINNGSDASQANAGEEPAIPTFQEVRQGWKWRSILFAAVTGLITLAVVSYLTDSIMALFARKDWIGWATLALLALVFISLVMISLREYLALRKLKNMTRLRKRAEIAYQENETEAAQKIIRQLQAMLADKKGMNWKQSRMAQHMEDVRNGKELLILAERELVVSLDTQAHEIIASTSRRVAVVTAISPFALIDMGFVAYENMKMLRKLSLLYGGKPGTLSMFRMIWMILGHLAVTGGVAIADDVLKQILSHSVAAKLSAKLGQGLMNGALTARIGVAGIGAVRPLPHLDSPPPSFKAIASEALDLRKL